MQRLRKILLYVMSLLYIAAGINHFWHPVFYTTIMPEYLPWHLELVYASGVAEVLLGLALLSPVTRPWAAWGIILMLIVFLSVHLHMATNTHLYPTVNPLLLWLRLPIQGVLIAWAWRYTGANQKSI